jgi:uncharacterized protein YjbJ (UPF0337 family)
MERNMNKDQIKGRAKEVKGNVKEAIGKVTGQESVEREGKADKLAGKTQSNYGDLKKDVKDKINKKK